MDPLLVGIGFVVGLILVLVSAERLVEATMRVARALGMSAFLVSVVFIGFDPENLAVGIAGTTEGSSGIVLGSIVGAAMVAIGLAFGITALLSPMRFGQAPPTVLAVPAVALALFAATAIDGVLDRVDGALLLGSYGLAVTWLWHLGRRGVDVRPRRFEDRRAEASPRRSKVRALAPLALALAGIGVGSHLLVSASQRIIQGTGISGTAFGMSILALAVSVEELARELPAAARGRPDIAVGNVVGSLLAFLLFNAGVIALVRPVEVPTEALAIPMSLFALTTAVVLGAIWRRSVPRSIGAALVVLYAVFVWSLYA